MCNLGVEWRRQAVWAAIWACFWTITWAALGLGLASAAAAGPTVRDVVGFTHILAPRGNDADALQALVSPGGAQAFMVTRRADVETDRNLYELLLLDLDPARLAAARPRAPQVLLTVAASRDENYAEPYLAQVRWLDDSTLVFLAHINDAPAQVYRLDVPTRQLSVLTSEQLPIVSFDVSHDARRVVYAVQVPNPPQQAGAAGVVVASQSFWAVKFGQHDLRSQDRQYRYLVADVGTGRPARALGDDFAERNGAEPVVSVSPDGRWALLPHYEPERQLAWATQYPLVAALTGRIAASLRVDPRGYFSRPSGYVTRRMLAWRLDEGRAQAVLDAPDDAMPGGGQRRRDRLWQGQGQSVVLAGTHLPAVDGGPPPPASHVVEYWPDTGRWTVIAVLSGGLRRAHDVADGHVVVHDADRRRAFLRQADGRWLEVSGGRSAPSTAWALRLVEGLNQPPDLVAAGPQGQTVRLTRLHARFDTSRWGSMRPYGWRDAKGSTWDGGLMLPEGRVPAGGHPLVIQTYGFAADRFYLDGPNESVGFTSAFAGRAFLREGIAVLAMPWRASSGAPDGDRAAVLAFNDGVRGAVDALVTQGLVDPSRVGIIGWSATGERVLNLVTFSDLPIRAATMADGDANTLFSVAVTYGANENLWVRAERLNEGLPFGAGLARWVRNDPSLNTDCVRTAMRIETYGPWVLNNWDLYALLRRQYKPAEMVVIPGGAHALSRPGERLLSLQGNVDWFRFWLTGQARAEVLLPGETTASLQAQYARWREMAALKQADDERPRCDRLSGSP